MELTHRFTVPGTVEDTWARFQDIASLAECFPGAQVTSVGQGATGATFEGTCKVKLGPIALVYAGNGTFVEKDDAAHRFVVEAKGRDKRGNGTAGATVTLTMAAVGATTAVEVHTDLNVTGKPAQFGRGVMQDVSDKLLGQFVACLEQRTGDVMAEQQAVLEPPQAAETTALVGSGQGEGLDTPSASGSGYSTGDSGHSTGGSGHSAGEASGPAHRAEDDALDLGATVLPVLLRSYWKQAAAVALLVALVGWVVRRR